MSKDLAYGIRSVLFCRSVQRCRRASLASVVVGQRRVEERGCIRVGLQHQAGVPRRPICLMHDVAGLIAPRPMLIVAGQDDAIFPIEGVRRAYAELEKIYAASGFKNNVELYVGDGGHRYYKKRVWPFIDEKLADIE